MIEDLTRSYDRAALECDGLTRVLHTVLTAAQVDHFCAVGQITDNSTGSEVAPHFWIDLPDGRRIDYRARMWLGDHQHIPHGIFVPNAFPAVVYDGETVDLEVLTPGILRLLLDGFDELSDALLKKICSYIRASSRGSGSLPRSHIISRRQFHSLERV